MAVMQILQKRGVRAPVPEEIEVGEVAINTAVGTLYVKTDDGDVIAVGGGQLRDSNQNIDGGGASTIYVLDQIINGGSA